MKSILDKLQLTKLESEIYMKIVRKGTMDDMFDFGYALGRERLAREVNGLTIMDGGKYVDLKGDLKKCQNK